MTVLSKSEFADSRGWSRAYVSKLAKQERLVLTEAGKVDVEATLDLISASADPSKAGVAERHQRDRAEKGVHSLVTPTAPASPPRSAGDGYQRARAHRDREPPRRQSLHTIRRSSQHVAVLTPFWRSR